MKTREQKQKDLSALTEQLSTAKSAMIVSFTNLTVNKDQEIRRQLHEVGASYQVVKNTLARLAVKGTPYEEASEHFKGVTAIVWTESDPVDLSKTVSKFIKEEGAFYKFKAGIVDGKVVNFDQVEAIASLPSKEALISKLLYVINAQAQGIVTIINAVPRDLAIVIKQIGDSAASGDSSPDDTAPVAEVAVAAEPKEAAAETAPAEAPEVAEEKVEADAPAAESAEVAEAPEVAEENVKAEAPAAETAKADDEAAKEAGDAEATGDAESTEAAPEAE